MAIRIKAGPKASQIEAIDRDGKPMDLKDVKGIEVLMEPNGPTVALFKYEAKLDAIVGEDHVLDHGKTEVAAEQETPPAGKHNYTIRLAGPAEPNTWIEKTLPVKTEVTRGPGSCLTLQFQVQETEVDPSKDPSHTHKVSITQFTLDRDEAVNLIANLQSCLDAKEAEQEDGDLAEGEPGYVEPSDPEEDGKPEPPDDPEDPEKDGPVDVKGIDFNTHCYPSIRTAMLMAEKATRHSPPDVPGMYHILYVEPEILPGIKALLSLRGERWWQDEEGVKTEDGRRFLSPVSKVSEVDEDEEEDGLPAFDDLPHLSMRDALKEAKKLVDIPAPSDPRLLQTTLTVPEMITPVKILLTQAGVKWWMDYKGVRTEDGRLFKV